MKKDYSKGYTPYTKPTSPLKKGRDLSGLAKYAKNSSKGGGGSINAPRHVQNARAMAMSNPVGSIVEGARVIGSGVKKLFTRNKA